MVPEMPFKCGCPQKWMGFSKKLGFVAVDGLLAFIIRTFWFLLVLPYFIRWPQKLPSLWWNFIPITTNGICFHQREILACLKLRLLLLCSSLNFLTPSRCLLDALIIGSWCPQSTLRDFFKDSVACSTKFLIFVFLILHRGIPGSNLICLGNMHIRARRNDLYSFLAGSSEHKWQPTMTADTTALTYWLNWRFVLSAVFVLSSLIVSAILIWRNEDCERTRRYGGENERNRPQTLYRSEAWSTCLKRIHPFWLLVFRALGFMVLLALLFANTIVDGVEILLFYTQWTFTLVTLYFGLGLSLSVYGCCIHNETTHGNWHNQMGMDAEQGSYRAPTFSGTVDDIPKVLNTRRGTFSLQTAGMWVYVHQILFQTCAGAVVLTDSVFWFIIYPFLTAKDFNLDFFIFCMHSVNAVFLLGETVLNSLRFPFFRIAYFVLWTGVFVVFQWILHACITLWWPYPFLDLSSPYAPLWYASVGLMHLPCYGVFALLIKMKNVWLSRTSLDQPSTSLTSF